MARKDFSLPKDTNQIEEAILAKIQQRVHSRTTEENFLARDLRHHDLSGTGWLEPATFLRAFLPYSAGVSEKDLRAIFDRYAEEGLLPIRPFAAEFTSGVRREAEGGNGLGKELEEEGPEASEAPEEILEKMKDSLYESPRGMTSLAAAIRDADPQNARVISFEVFQKVLGDFFQDLQVSVGDLRAIFDLFRQPHVNQLPYDEFFLALKEEISQERRAAIRQAFRRLDVASEGLVDLGVLLRSFNANRHPQVSAGTRTAEEVLEEFADTLKDHISFRRGQRSYPTNLVAWEEFEDYYKSISGCFASDEDFTSVLAKVWDLDKAFDAAVETRAALARPAAGAPQKVRTGLHHWQTNTLPMTVTHHKVDMVTKIEDVMQRTRAQITRRGLRAAVDVVQHFYAADDDVDDQLDTYEFRQACRKAGLSFREAEEASIFEACAETKGKLQLPVFLKLLHGELSKGRRGLVERAFAVLGGDPGDPRSVVSPATLKERFVAQAHPLVVRGQLEPGYVLAEFLDTFSQLAHVLGGCENGMVSFADFLAYYEVVSSTVENDSLFDLVVQRIWDLPKVDAAAQGYAAGGESPRRSRVSLEQPVSPMAERRPPAHAGPSAYAVESPRGPKQDHKRFSRGPQASAITKSSIVFNERGSSLTEVLERLRRSIALRGLRGWLAVVQRFQNFDYRRNGTIMRLDWQRLNRVLGLGLSPEDQELLFKELSQKKKGAAMDYLQCLHLLRGDSLEKDREQAVEQLYEALGSGSQVTAQTLKNRFDASSAPQCLLRRKDPRQAEQEFFDAVDFFAAGSAFDFGKFLDFFRMVSAVHEDDDEFRLMTSSAFGA
ncbi:Caps2 [Symbiodinium sp. CCMP2456]|nr:Caps2 [Symbiodinium sp. CCMP2456]